MSIESDIPQANPAASLGEDVTLQYAKFFSSYGASILDYAQAYSSNRLQYVTRTMSALEVSDPVALAQAALLHRVLYEAQFTPAHPGRYSPKKMGPIQYFVLHRPGDDPRACTFSNTVATFLVPPQRDGGKTQSTHFVIGPQGQLVQMVDLDDSARHIGESGNVNNTSAVGVEISGAITEPVTEAQFLKTARLVATMAIIGGFEIDAAHILKHSDLSPITRRDPGPHLDYARLLTEAIRIKRQIGAAQLHTLYKSPFDPSKEVYRDMAVILDAANASRAPGRKALRISSAARIESVLRTDQMTQTNRTSVAAAAQTQYESIAANLAADVANRTFLEQQAKAAEEELKKRQEAASASAAVVGYNVETGLWSDGKQV